MTERSYGFWGIALSLLLHAAGLALWQPFALHAEKLHVAGEIELITVVRERPPAPESLQKKVPSPPARPRKTRRIVKKTLAPAPKPVALAKTASPEPAVAPAAEEEPKRAVPQEHTTPPTEAVVLSCEETLKLYAHQVRQRIETQKSYPKRARRQQMEGAVRIRFRLSPAGEVKAITIVRGSRFSMLNTAAKNAVLQAAPFPRLPDRMDGKPINMEVTLNFELT